MATHRRTTKTMVEVPLSSIPKQNMAGPSMKYSPFLPTLLEAILLAIYPGTLFLGSLFSVLNATNRNAPYSGSSQSHVANLAPSYFAKKSNVFNVYFVKIGWVWTTVAFFLFIFTHGSLGPRFRPKMTKRRVQATLRYLCVTLVWIFVTQWFFGPPIIDRGFRWTGGQCEVIYGDDPESLAKHADMGNTREVFTHAACKAIGGRWKGGHDISGHVFLLILGSAMLWIEFLPAVLTMEGLREARRVKTADGLIRSASYETSDAVGNIEASKELGIGVQMALGVTGLSWWMLLMTAAYFHTWFEKVTGLLVAFSALYVVYFLPRAVPTMRKVIGLPGV